jgi:oxalate decarboxylase/phosphoglucose isomerase-like protein (cupin superfamily)
VAARVAEAVGPGTVVKVPPDMPQRIVNTGSDDLLFLAPCTPRFTPGCYAVCWSDEA